MFPDFRVTETATLPFTYFLGESGASISELERWLNWFDTVAPWQEVITNFYEQYEISLLHVEGDLEILGLISNETIDTLHTWMSTQFGGKLASHVDVTAHKLIKGQTIRIHNDHRPNGESHRLLLQINRSWDASHGGYLMFFNGPDSSQVHRIIEPRNGSLQAFEISEQSHHAVSTIHDGTRYTVVYSFYPAG